MSIEKPPATHPSWFAQPVLPTPLVCLALLLAFTHAAVLLMNQPAAYWLDPQYYRAEVPFGFLMRAGPLAFVALAAFYLGVTGFLLLRLRAAPGLFLAGLMAIMHSFALRSLMECGLQPIYSAHSAAACYTWLEAPTYVFFVLAGAILLWRHLPGWLSRWGGRVLLILGALWAGLMLYGIGRAAFPPASPWKPLAPAHSPGQRSSAALAYDPERQRAVLFGGLLPWNGHAWIYDNSTWEWDGQDWHKMDTPVAPTGRAMHAMVYDQQSGKVLLFGGYNSTGPLGDLWEWDGKEWRRLCPVCNPAARYMHQMVYDPALKQVLLYGGQDVDEAYPEGWTWNGTSWTYSMFDNSSPPLQMAPLIYDGSQNRIVSFTAAEWGGTWILQGNQWDKLGPAGGPPLRDQSVMVYDLSREASVLFGGFNVEAQSYFDDTWVLRGDYWAKLDTPAAPPGRSGAVAFYDPVRRSVILFGGTKGDWEYKDMWELVLPKGDEQ